MLKIFFGIIVLLSLGAATYYFYGSKIVPAPQGEVAAIIRYTDRGYDPSEVRIKKGQVVRWTNTSATEMWPASAVHPTHSIYPEKSKADCLGSSFDSCRRLQVGESWEFTFNESGDWRFHDHVRSSKTGIVHVE